MKAKEIRELSVEELEVKLTDLKKDLFNLRLQNATNQLDNPTRIAEVKRDIAPLPEPIRLPSGFLETGLSGKILIQPCPPRLV